MIDNVCDKCLRPVDPTNDAMRLHAQILDDAGRPGDALWLQITTKPRHLLPIEGCEGSPSRAQYLEGQPRDTRDYPYEEWFEPLVRAAYEKLTTITTRE
jgi:hypothetical protein